MTTALPPAGDSRPLLRDGGSLLPPILAGEIEPVPSPPDAEARPAAVTPPMNLPVSVTSFVGRQREVTEVQRLRGTTRLLTLTGAGGCGKTRLALAVAAEVQADYPDSVWLVELAPLTDPALVVQAVGAALRVREQPGQAPLESLVAHLVGKHLLLLLDNCEHLLAACASLVARLLPACPGLQVLATSRERLGIAGETAWPVPPLNLPAPNTRPPLDELVSYDAVQLLVERARAAAPSFALTARNAAAVTEICRRLDGIPLALELAAARLTVLSPAELATRLEDRFRLLTAGNRAALPQHQTLRAAVDWSYDLLVEDERTLFRRLAVFAGGWTLAAAEAVCPGEGIAVEEVLALLASLADKSLVQVEDQGDVARYRLLETVRQYAWERLAEAGEAGVVQSRQAAWCLALAQQAELALQSGEQRLWLDRLAAEHDNLRAALAWCLEHEPETGLGIASGVWPYWMLRSHVAEGRRWLDTLLAHPTGQIALRLTALSGVAVLASCQSDLAAMHAYAEESLALSRELAEAPASASALGQWGYLLMRGGDYEQARAVLEEQWFLIQGTEDRRSHAQNLRLRGRVAGYQGDYRRARGLLEESLALAHSMGDCWLVSDVLRDLGNVVLITGDPLRAEALLSEALALAQELASRGAVMLHGFLAHVARWQGQLERAQELYEASLAGARVQEDRAGIASTLEGLGQVARLRGDLVCAAELLRESLRLFTDMEHVQGIGATLCALGLVAERQGDLAQAEALLGRSLALRARLGRTPGVAECLEGLAGVAAGWGLAVRAIRLLGAAEALREILGAPLPPVERPYYEATVGQARTRLGERTFAAAWAAGRALTLDEAIAEALRSEVAPPPVMPGSAASAPGYPDGLTPREVDVLRLIAAGLSNQEIAAELILSVRTVERHITNIYGKIDARGRADATAYALRQRLL